MLDQLPEDVQNKLYSEFLYHDFLQKFRDTFRIPKTSNQLFGSNSVYYTWEDQNYREFMIDLLSNLEPRREKKGSILFQELEEISEIFFVSQGTVDIGYELNRQRKFVLRYSDKKVAIGAYNCSFNTRSLFIYRCKTETSGYFIRKCAWMELLGKDPFIENYIKQNIEKDYNTNIEIKVLTVKEMHIAKMAKREDLKQVIVISNKDATGNPSGSIMKDKQGESMPFTVRDRIDNLEMNEDEASEVKETFANYRAKIESYTQGVEGLLGKLDTISA